MESENKIGETNQSTEKIEQGKIDSSKHENRKPPRGSKLPLIIALVIVLGLVGFRMINLFTPEEAEKESKVSVEVTKAEVKDIITSTPISGRVKPNEEVNVVPLMQGKVTAVFAKPGDFVNEGEVLFTVDGTQFETQINQATESLNVAKSTYDRIQMLYGEGAISLQELEQAKLNYVNAQQAQIQASSAYDNCKITAPISGYITANNLNVGTLPPQTVPSMVIADVSSLVVETEISESVIADISEGDVVEVYVDSVSKNPIISTIKSISLAPTQGKMTYPIKIALGKNEKVKAGMFAKVKLVNSKKKAVLCIPSETVMINDGVTKVAVLKDKKVKLIEVKTGLDNGEFVEIVEGLKEGESVISKGQQYVNDGYSVKVVKKDENEYE